MQAWPGLNPVDVSCYRLRLPQCNIFRVTPPFIIFVIPTTIDNDQGRQIAKWMVLFRKLLVRLGLELGERDVLVSESKRDGAGERGERGADESIRGHGDRSVVWSAHGLEGELSYEYDALRQTPWSAEP
jgi:hypothetical protein